MSNKLFCEYCNKDVEYYTEDVQFTEVVNGKTYVYTGREVRCIHCGNKLFHPDVTEQNRNELLRVVTEAQSE